MKSCRCFLLLMTAAFLVSSLTGCAGELTLKEKYRFPSVTKPLVTEPSSPVPTDPGSEPADPGTEPTDPGTEPVTDPTSTLLTDPAGSGGVGPYSLAELELLDRTNTPYGPGAEVDEKGRPYGAMHYNEQYSQYDAWFIGPDDGNIYLTFDLGWENQGLTHKFLDTLKEKDVKAVFFVLKEYCDRNQDVIRRIIDEGHILASHAYQHKTLADMSVEQIADQIWKLHAYIREEFGYEMTLFRPPSGEFSEQVLAVAHGMGYRTVNWSYAYVDWLADDQPDVGASYDRLMRNAHSGCIYLLHTVSTTNEALLGDLIDGLRAQGYEFALFTDQTGE